MAKTVLLTGASRGIGKGILARLCKENDYTIIATATSNKGVEEIDQVIRENKATGIGMIWNGLEEGSSDDLMEKIKEKYSAFPDILINNAGITRDNLLIRMKEDQWNDVIQMNLTAGMKLSQICCKGMVRKRWGRIINISSVVACIGNPGQANYTAAKAGMIGFSKSLAAEVASRNITVNCICPGFIDTEMLDFMTDEQKSQVLSKIPMKRLGTCEEVAHAVAFLASEDSGYITGSSIQINGGLVML